MSGETLIINICSFWSAALGYWFGNLLSGASFSGDVLVFVICLTIAHCIFYATKEEGK